MIEKIESLLTRDFESKRQAYIYLAEMLDNTTDTWRRYEGIVRRNPKLNKKLNRLIDGVLEDSSMFDFVDDYDNIEIEESLTDPFETTEEEQAYLDYRRVLYEAKIKKNNELITPKLFRVDHPWFMLMHVSDMHLDDEGSDIWLIIDTLNKLNGFPFRIVNGGDNTNNFFKAWAKHIQQESRLTPNDGVKALSIVSKKMQDNLIAGILGNHDRWIDDEIGINPYTMIIENYCKNVVLQPEYLIYDVYSSVSNAKYGLTLLTHGNVGGRSSKNPHHANTNVWLDMEYSFDRVISGHFHWPTAAVAQIPLKSGTFESHLLGSLKGGDQYARGLHLRNRPNINPFTFTFCLPDGLRFSVADKELAVQLANNFKESYG